MADKPETKVEPKPVEVNADPDVSQLARQIAGEPDPVIVEGKDSVSPKDKSASEETEAKPKSEGESQASEEKTKPGDGEGEPGEGEGEGEQEDLFKDLASKPKEALKVLLEHPVLGPILQHWSDRAGDAQVTTALDRQKPITEAETKQAEAERVEDEHFSGMTQEQITEEIAGDEKAATAYARYQERKQAEGKPNAEAIANASQIYSYASQVASVSSLLEESELTAEVKESLKPGHFMSQGAEGIKEWGKAVLQAIITHEATAKAEKLKEDGWEAYKEERLAEIDGERPAVVSGRRDGPKPDLMKTPSEDLLESALSVKPKKG